MKFEIKTFGDKPQRFSFTNTPLGCVIWDSDGNLEFDGLNLTEEGEFIPAPGFADAKSADAVAISAYSAIAELERALGDAVHDPQGNVQG